MRRTLNEECDIGKKVLEVEQLMDKYGIKITGDRLQLVISVPDKGSIEYNIGRDSDQFPRFVDEPFSREV